MRRLLLSLIFFALLPLAFADESLQVSVNTSKTSILPGDDFSLIITFKSLTEVLDDLEYKVIIPENFSSTVPGVGYDSSIPYKRLGELGPGASTQAGVPITVSDSARGDYQFKVIADYRQSILPLNFEHIVTVNEPKELVKIKNVVTDKEVSPGDDFNLTLILESDKDVDNLEVSIQLDEGVGLLSDTELRKFKGLNKSEELVINYSLTTSMETLIGTRSIPVRIKYEYNGKQYDETSSTGLNIKGKARISLTDVEILPLKPVVGDQFSIRLEFENTGTDDAENIVISLNTSLQGIKRGFTSSIKKGNDGETILYLTSVNETGIKDIGLELIYHDDFGRHVLKESFSVNISENVLSKVFSMIMGAVLTTAVIAVFILIIRTSIKK